MLYMLLLDLSSNPLLFVAFVIALVIAISVHEFSHAFIANQLGDPTAKYQGRMTLNPLSHLDPIGTILLFIVGFGWGRPVPVNPQYFARPGLDELLVALGGPASNFIVAALCGLLLRAVGGALGPLDFILVMTIQLNVLLMLFNLIPIPPLDGSKVFRVVLGEQAFRMLELYSLPLIFFLLLLLQATPLGDALSTGVTTLTDFFVGR